MDLNFLPLNWKRTPLSTGPPRRYTPWKKFNTIHKNKNFTDSLRAVTPNFKIHFTPLVAMAFLWLIANFSCFQWPLKREGIDCLFQGIPFLFQHANKTWLWPGFFNSSLTFFHSFQKNRPFNFTSYRSLILLISAKKETQKRDTIWKQ